MREERKGRKEGGGVRGWEGEEGGKEGGGTKGREGGGGGDERKGGRRGREEREGYIGMKEGLRVSQIPRLHAQRSRNPGCLGDMIHEMKQSNPTLPRSYLSLTYITGEKFQLELT